MQGCAEEVVRKNSKGAICSTLSRRSHDIRRLWFNRFLSRNDIAIRVATNKAQQ